MCGLGAIINNTVQKLNKPVFNIIGIANDSRGGDSCGIFIDKKVEYGVDKTKLYRDFMYESELLESTSSCKLAFLHCRKASPGLKINLASAQPVVIEEDGEVKYVLMHNGTIHNSEELAKKYIPSINVKDLTDSQIMARIFYYKGYDALVEYNGSAVFIIADYRENPDEPKVLLWKGESKDTSYGKTISEERPIYIVTTKTCSILSSIALHLDAMYGQDHVKTISSNTLLELRNTSLYVIKKYDRSNQCQTKTYYSSNNKSKSSYNDYDDYDDYYGYNYNHNYSSNSNYIYNNRLGEFMSGTMRAHGMRYCSPSGSAFTYKMASSNFKEMWFYQGVLLYNKDCYDIIEKVRKAFMKEDPKFSSPAEFIREHAEIVCYFSYLPIKTSDIEKYFVVNEALLWEPFNGSLHNLLGSSTMKKCVNGNVSETTYSNNQLGFDLFKQASEGFYFDKEYFINLINTNYNASIQLEGE